MEKNKITGLIKTHSAYLILFLSFIAVTLLYPVINKYAYLLFASISFFYFAYVLFEKYKYTRKILLVFAVLIVSLFYCFITYTSFYPDAVKIKSGVSVTTFSGWGYYNVLSYGLRNKQLSLPIEPSSKLKALDNPYNNIELNDNLSWEQYDYIMDFSFYKGKYYLYFGIVPALTVYLPFIIVTNNFIPDSLVVLGFSLLAFYLALLIFFKICRDTMMRNNFLIELMAIIAIGLCSSFTFLISYPRIYEVAIISAVFFCELSFLFLYLYWRAENKSKKLLFLFVSGICIGLACGCRPFYALIVPVQALILINFSEMRKNWKTYIFYFIPIGLCAAGLMAYNYARFDSFFEFGNKYQLTVYDMNNWKISFSNTWKSIKDFLFMQPHFDNTFPYIYAGMPTDRWYKGEPLVGIFYLYPFIAFLAVYYMFFKDKTVEIFNKKYVSGLLLTGIINLLVVSTMASLYRFLADFSVYLIIISLLMAIYWYKKYDSKSTGFVIKYLFMFTLFFGIVFSFATSVSNSLFFVIENMPDLYARIASLF